VSDAQAPSSIFRAEAIAHRARPQTESHVLEISPRWTRWAYWLVVAVAGGAVVYGMVARVHEYASGPALIRVEGRLDVTARSAGTVSKIAVRPGQRVAEGEVLVQLHDAAERAELERTRHEFELQLVKLLREPTDEAARMTLAGLRAQRELAQARLDQRVIVAPKAGTTSDVRIRQGQQLAAGETLLAIVDSDAPCVVVAMVPGHFRPQIRTGMPLRLEIDGYRYAYREVVVDKIGDEIVGPAELARYLGPELGDTMNVAGPTLLVEAHLPSNTFHAQGEEFHYYDGMRARADLRLRTTSVSVALLPGLRYLIEGSHD
jgi:multidrug resistance efflux pump